MLMKMKGGGMQKFTRALTREIDVAGERLAVTLDENGLSIRPVGARKPPRQATWAAILCALTGGAGEPADDEIRAALEALRGGSSTKPAARPLAAAAKGDD